MCTVFLLNWNNIKFNILPSKIAVPWKSESIYFLNMLEQLQIVGSGRIYQFKSVFSIILQDQLWFSAQVSDITASLYDVIKGPLVFR